MTSHQPGSLREPRLRTTSRAEPSAVEPLVSPEQLRQALGRYRRASTRKLGARLLELKLINEEQLAAALAIQRTDSARHLGHILVDLGFLSNAQLHQVLCQQLGIPLIRLPQFGIDRAVLRLVPDDLVHQCGAVPLCRIDGRLVVAVSDPLDPQLLERLRFFAQTPLIAVMAARDEIEQAIRNYYSPLADIPYGIPSSTSSWREGAPEFPGQSAGGNELEHAVLKFVRKMLADAHASGASDIHVDSNAAAGELGVRFRHHGRLTEYLRVPRHLRSSVVRRIKVMAGLEPSQQKRARTGHIDIEVDGTHLQLRANAVPAGDGTEHIALKLLRLAQRPQLDRLGFGDSQLHTVKQFLTRSSGLVLVAGPADSGRSTTAHALLTALEHPGAKIWTVEDPIEVRRPGVSQVEIDASIGWDYPAAMRSIVRADADVIMLGDMRERDTAALAVEAALRGARVVAALHANDAADGLARLLELRVNAFSMSDALIGAVAQRLARRLCRACRVSRPIARSEMRDLVEEYCAGTPLRVSAVRAEWGERFGDELRLYDAGGCELCGGTGYDGRVGLFEVLPAGPAIRRLIRERRPLDELLVQAMREGMRTLRQDGIEKALAGFCDLLEVRAASV